MAESSQSSAECPSCGRFVGPYSTCPYCGADVGQRMAVRAFKYGSLLLAVAGVALLLWVARHSETPTVEIGSLGGTMNWAYIRVEGLASRQPGYDDEGDLRFWLWDGTGEILVMAYGPEAEALLALGRVPAMGDRVALEGTLRVREGFQYLILNDPQQVTVGVEAPLALTLAEVAAGLRYRRVMVRGVIRDDRLPYEGLRILTLRDATGEIDVTLAEEAQIMGGPLPDLRVGQTLQAVGAVDLYRGQPQISVGRGSDLVLLDEEVAIAPQQRIGELVAGDGSSLVAVEGEIVEVGPFSAGVKLLVDDGSGRVTVLVWQDLCDAWPECGTLQVGAGLLARGVVAEYRGALEVIPELPSDVVLLAPPPGEAEGVAAVAPSAEPTGSVVATVVVPTARPTVTASATVTIAAPTAELTVTVGMPTVEATATADSTATAVPTAVPSRQPTPSVETRAIGAIGSDDVGRLLTVEAASIAEVDYFSLGIRFTLADGTGRIILLVWQDVLEEIAERYDLFPGAQVRISGEVDEYQGELEIVPRRGSDVVLIARADRLPIETRAVRDVSAADEGRVFSLAGVVTRLEGRGWLRVWLDDGTGEILIFVPERMVAYLPPGVGAGARLRVSGEVDVYQGVLEIIPRAGADVEVQ